MPLPAASRNGRSASGLSLAADPARGAIAWRLAASGSRVAALAIAASSGAVSVTLSDVRPDPRASIGMGVGIPRADGGGCLMSQSVARTTEWLYHGIWAVLVRWFRVPKEPPILPALSNEIG